MNISVFRIDDRLIHGQIITSWIAYSDAEEIIVADDFAANDEFSQSLLKMATPDSVKLHILSVQDAISLLKGDGSKAKVLLLAKTPKSAFELLEGGVFVKSINIGNLNMKKGKTKILGNFWVTPEDVGYLRKINEKGAALEVRAVPNEKSQDVMDLLKKNQLM